MAERREDLPCTRCGGKGEYIVFEGASRQAGWGWVEDCPYCTKPEPPEPPAASADPVSFEDWRAQRGGQDYQSQYGAIDYDELCDEEFDQWYSSHGPVKPDLGPYPSIDAIPF